MKNQLDGMIQKSRGSLGASMNKFLQKKGFSLFFVEGALFHLLLNQKERNVIYEMLNNMALFYNKRLIVPHSHF